MIQNFATLYIFTSESAYHNSLRLANTSVLNNSLYRYAFACSMLQAHEVLEHLITY